MDVNPFEILGVEIDATLDEIDSAWKSRAKQLHPDRYPGAPAEVKARLNEEMARLNAARQILVDDLEGARLRFRAGGSGAFNHQPSGSTSGARSGPSREAFDRCEVCGSKNCGIFEFRRQIGLLLYRRIGGIAARLCKNCAQSIGRTFQSRTLTQGWWGPISALTNVGFVWGNTRELNRARRLSAPSGAFGMPLSPGRPVFLRPFAWIGPVVILTLVASIVGNQSPQPAGWQVGDCVVVYLDKENQLMPRKVACALDHYGVITSEVTLSENCDEINVIITATKKFCITVD